MRENIFKTCIVWYYVWLQWILQVKLVGEGADDAGGVFDDTMTEMCNELVSGAVPLLIPTPNSTNGTGYNRDKFLLNPMLDQTQHLLWFKFLGKLASK